MSTSCSFFLVSKDASRAYSISSSACPPRETWPTAFHGSCVRRSSSVGRTASPRQVRASRRRGSNVHVVDRGGVWEASRTPRSATSTYSRAFSTSCALDGWSTPPRGRRVRFDGRARSTAPFRWGLRTSNGSDVPSGTWWHRTRPLPSRWTRGFVWRPSTVRWPRPSCPWRRYLRPGFLPPLPRPFLLPLTRSWGRSSGPSGPQHASVDVCVRRKRSLADAFGRGGPSPTTPPHPKDPSERDERGGTPRRKGEGVEG
eukprot:scaffold136_cov325-Pavlova_lutheri.AAC.14